VFVAQKNIQQKELINPAELDMQLIEVTNLKGTPVASLSGLNRLRARTLVKAGSVLFRESFENEPVIKNGDWITASSVAGSVIVEIDAEAKQEGIEGEIIRIVSKDKKQFKAKIIDSNNVIILE
jgi:flagella basal body P-ring formation protein FlgA